MYRALDHKAAKVRCKQLGKENHVLNFPPAIKDLAVLFVSLQEKRHEADYDPRSTLTTFDATTQLADVRDAIKRFERASKKHRKAFAAYILINLRVG